MQKWLRLFRVVNLPTVPGDVFVGAAAAICGAEAGGGAGFGLRPVWWAAGASVFIYMFGLAQNDIMGAKTDKDRPIATGEISMDSALAAAAVCIAAASGCAYMGGLLVNLMLLAFMITLYNRTKAWWAMGACRALNVVIGAAALGAVNIRAIAAAVIWWLYISLVTLYSEGEELDPAKKRRVGFLVGAIVYLQLAALIVFALAFPNAHRIRPLLIAGAALLILLRVVKRLLPKVSAS